MSEYQDAYELLKGHRSSIIVEGPGAEWVMQRS